MNAVLTAIAVLASFLAAIPARAADPPHNTLTDAERQAGWILLFDGVSTAGWRQLGGERFPEKGWLVEDGCLKHIAKGGGGDITPDGEYEHFELQIDWKIAPGANSGIKYRVAEKPGASFAFGPEYQIIDDAGNADAKTLKRASGSLYDMFPVTQRAANPPGEWNQTRIIIQGNRGQHWLNGVKVVEFEIGGDAWQEAFEKSKYKGRSDFANPAKGRIALQDHGDEICFRNIRIRHLSPTPPGD